MKSFLIKRLLLFIPSLVLISLLIFAMSKLAPGSPVDQISFDNEKSRSYEAYLNEVKLLEKKFNFDKPEFYFSLNSRSELDQSLIISDKSAYNSMHKISKEIGD